jgi:hypothetical protein
MNVLKRIVAVATLVIATSACCVTHEHTYLTWQDADTSTKITVNYHVREAGHETVVYYDTESRGGDRSKYKFQAKGKAHHFQGATEERWIHSAELSGLEPGGTYYFVVGAQSEEYNKEQKFRTLPSDPKAPLRVVTGGDMGVWPMARQLMELAGKQSPDVIIIGGDIVYENGDLSKTNWYDKWLDDTDAAFITPDGFKIPMILTIGNHETNKSENVDRTAKAPFYYQYFPQGGDPFFARKLGGNAVLLSLDSGHTVSHEAQVPWLREQLTKYADVKNSFTCYHVPLFPSHRDFDGGGSVAGRTHWQPLFDEFKLTASFENHDHTFKRTKLIRGTEVHPEGTLYIGDGCMGVPPREIKNADKWYMEKALSAFHFWVIEVTADSTTYTAINDSGAAFDKYPG